MHEKDEMNKISSFFVLVVHVKKHGITSNFYPETTKRINLFKQNSTRMHIQAEPHQGEAETV